MLPGVRGQRLEPGPTAAGTRPSRPPHPLPRSLGEALRALRENTTLRTTFGAGFIDYFIRIKEAELARFEQEVSAWEHRECFVLFSARLIATGGRRSDPKVAAIAW